MPGASGLLHPWKKGHQLACFSGIEALEEQTRFCSRNGKQCKQAHSIQNLEVAERVSECARPSNSCCSSVCGKDTPNHIPPSPMWAKSSRATMAVGTSCLLKKKGVIPRFLSILAPAPHEKSFLSFEKSFNPYCCTPLITVFSEAKRGDCSLLLCIYSEREY